MISRVLFVGSLFFRVVSASLAFASPLNALSSPSLDWGLLLPAVEVYAVVSDYSNCHCVPKAQPSAFSARHQLASSPVSLSVSVCIAKALVLTPWHSLAHSDLSISTHGSFSVFLSFLLFLVSLLLYWLHSITTTYQRPLFHSVCTICCGVITLYQETLVCWLPPDLQPSFSKIPLIPYLFKATDVLPLSEAFSSVCLISNSHRFSLFIFFLTPRLLFRFFR